MLNRFAPQAAALGMAALATVSTLGGLGSMADRHYSSASSEVAQATALAAARAHALQLAQANVPVQRVVIIGRAVQQVVITGHRRG